MKLLLLLALVGVTLVSGIRVRDNSKTCRGCREVTTFIKKIADEIPNDPALKSRLIELCTEYTFGPKNETVIACTSKVNRWVRAIQTRVDTKNICEDIHACYRPASSSLNFIQRVSPKADPGCDFCIFALDKIRDIFTGEPTEIEMKHVFEDGCQYLGQFAQDCTKLVDDYVDTMINYMKNAFNSKQCCASLKYCSGAGPARVNTLHRVRLHQSKSQLLTVMAAPSNATVGDDMNCVICKKLVKIIQTQLKDNATDDQIVNVLNDVCLLFPSNERPHCHDVVTQYAKNLIQILTQDVDPDFACTLAGICTNNLLKQNIKQKHSNVICVECQMITHFIQNQLYDYNNEKQIEEFIENQVCKKVGHILDEKNCDQFVKMYGPIIMQTIAQEIFDPKTFCFKEIHVCKQPAAFDKGINPRACDMCVHMIEKLHLENATEVDIERFIKSACDHLEPAHKMECAMMAKTFGPYIFDVLKHHEDSKQICQALDICHVPGKVNLLGGHKCTFGPSYWCLSSHHADACSAVEYCDRKKNPVLTKSIHV